MDRNEAEHRLKQIFGIEQFYDEQWRAISKILSGERVLMIERTGFGKSLCYQFPATQFPGLTVVFSPLIALMRDQVNGLLRRGIRAAYINSEQSQEDNDTAIEQALSGKLKILYIAPERQENRHWNEAIQQMKNQLSMVVVDEAHTISTWGHDFRPAFRRIINLVQLLPTHLPVLATTATATKRVQYDIEKQIGGKLTTIRGPLIRSNFKLRVICVKSEDEKMVWIAENINHFHGTGIIYSGTRLDTEVYAKWLQYVGIEAIDYNAGFDAATRKDVENGFMENRWKCIVSTNALGMGVDKPDIRFVIHTQMPASPIHYYQEIGRAGRDGLPTEIILFYNDSKVGNEQLAQDIILPKSFIDNARPSLQKYERVINLLLEEPLTERELMRKGNLKQGQVRVIKYDLIDQGIIKEVFYGKSKKCEYQYGAPDFNYGLFDELRKAKLEDLQKMETYVYTNIPRMKYLCSFLDSDEQSNYTNCDNTNLPKIKIGKQNPLYIEKLQHFRESYFPELELCESSFKYSTTEDGERVRLTIKIPSPNKIHIFRNSELINSYCGKVISSDFSSAEVSVIKELIHAHRLSKSHITDGVAASYYGVSNVGTVIHRCKYENGGDFPDFLLRLTLKAFDKKFGKQHFDMVLYVPPTHSGNLVRNFAIKFSSVIKIPICHDLKKIRETEEQKVFQNRYGKQDNIKDAFDINANLNGKNIIVVDDIFDSGETLKEIGKLLTRKGANYIVPVVIAKTVGGTL